MTERKRPLRDIAAGIDAHLRRFEADPNINTLSMKRTLAYYHARARVAGRYVGVMYVSYQDWCRLTRDEAEAYLAWLDAGNVGQHYRITKTGATPSV